MTRQFSLAVVAMVALNALVTGYGAVAAGQEDQARCAQDHGIVRNHECIRAGHVLFGVPL